MKFRLKIPKEHITLLEKIIKLNEEEKNKILTNFKAFDPPKINKDLHSIEQFKDYPKIYEFIVTIFGLYRAFYNDQLIKSTEEFIKILTDQFNEQTNTEFNSSIPSLRDFLKGILSEDTKYHDYEKALQLLSERGKLIEHTRIMTDIRPVFKDDMINVPEKCLIMHNLRIGYIEDLKYKKKLFFALDNQDLLKLKSQIERALKKEEELKKLCKKSGLMVFEV